jgi:flagellar basal body-associated protein FliL
MTRLRLFGLISLTAVMLASPAWAEGNKNAVKQDTKVSPFFLQMPRMAVPVNVEGTEAYRQLEVELWVYEPNPELMIKLNAQRSTVADKIRANLKKNKAETYMSAEEGPLAIKEIARDAVEDVIGKDANEDVLIKSLLVR